MRSLILLGLIPCLTLALPDPSAGQVEVGTAVVPALGAYPAPSTPLAPVASVEVQVQSEGDDSLSRLREGEWSVARVTLVRRGPVTTGTSPSLWLRWKGALGSAAVPALLRRGPAQGADGRWTSRESYVGRLSVQGADLVAEVPLPVRPRVAESYDLVDISASIEWRRPPELTAVKGPAGQAPGTGDRPLVILVHGRHGVGPGSESLADFRRPVFNSMAAIVTRSGVGAATDVYRFAWPTYRRLAESAPSLAKQVKALGRRRSVVFLTHGAGARLAALAAAALGTSRSPVHVIAVGGDFHGSVRQSLAAGPATALASALGDRWTDLALASDALPATPGRDEEFWDGADDAILARRLAELGVPVAPRSVCAAGVLGKQLTCVASEGGTAPLVGLMGQIDPALTATDGWVTPFSALCPEYARHSVFTVTGVGHGDLLLDPGTTAEIASRLGALVSPPSAR